MQTKMIKITGYLPGNRNGKSGLFQDSKTFQNSNANIFILVYINIPFKCIDYKVSAQLKKYRVKSARKIEKCTAPFEDKIRSICYRLSDTINKKITNFRSEVTNNSRIFQFFKAPT